MKSRETGWKIELYAKKLKQKNGHSYGPFYASYPEDLEIGSFNLKYSINSEELMENAEGELHVVVSVEG